MNKEEYDKFKKLVKEAKKTLLNPHDSPITRFVVIGRAIDLARAGRYYCDCEGFKNDALAEALDDAIVHLEEEII